VQILDRGDEIRISNDPSASEKGCVKDYMLPIFERGLALAASGSRDDDNFDQAARLNEEILVALARIGSRP